MTQALDGAHGPGSRSVRPLLYVNPMANAKIIAIIDAENRAQNAAVAQDIQTMLMVVEDEIDAVRINAQQQIDELKQRVAKLEGASP